MWASASISRDSVSGVSAPIVLAGRPRFAVEKARIRSPLQCSPTPPVRAIPKAARRATRSHWPGSNGASVATSTMIDPAPGAAGSGAGNSSTVSARPTGAPLIASRSRRPWFACTRTPTV